MVLSATMGRTQFIVTTELNSLTCLLLPLNARRRSHQVVQVVNVMRRFPSWKCSVFLASETLELLNTGASFHCPDTKGTMVGGDALDVEHPWKHRHAQFSLCKATHVTVTKSN